ncbi:MAG TPA: DNA translocase FtsK 4TM domain-containing protein, partial [Gemmatimonadaceae bacterium]|nr:DNA translocase FtsK 4TM domain-containing protein [Gemmatimonadaceae bacterium]
MVSEHVRRELVGIALLLFAIFLGGALLAGGGVAPWVATDTRACGAVHGWFGPAGSCLRAYLQVFFGVPAALLLPLIPAIHALRLFGRMQKSTDRSWLIFLAGGVILLPIALGLTTATATPSRDEVSGLWGNFVALHLKDAFGIAGSWIIVFLLLCALTAATLQWNPIRVLLAPRPPRPRAPVLNEPDPDEFPGIEHAEAPVPLAVPAPPPVEAEQPKKSRPRAKRAEPLLEPPDPNEPQPPVVETDELPPVDLLTPPPEKNVDVGKRELDVMGEKLLAALRTFKVDGDLGERTTGPVVTQFEVIPAAGIKVRQIASLANDLALAMRAPSIRIVAPIPGKGAVGVEVPNPVADIVMLRELLESSEFRNARAALPLALGKDLEGRPVIADLAKMPHLLIAGATGSGKSVCVNTLITALVYKHTPKTLKFLMVDPKMVELSVYNALPHKRLDVVTDNRDAAKVLKWAQYEMERRYRLLAENGCRNVQEFNRRVEAGTPLQNPKQSDVAFEERTYTEGLLPYIVVVIDELADLMMTVQAEIETPLAMLAQKARAIGLHLILATQRPSVNVITGLIKANFPSRIAFRVASQVDSRTIIDGIGAESLLGNGDMLFIPPGKSEAARLQGAYVSSDETEKLLGWYKAHTTAAVVEGPGEDIFETVRRREQAERDAAEMPEKTNPADRDDLFREAAAACIQNQQGSTSLLQRRLEIGYGRAARIIDQL